MPTSTPTDLSERVARLRAGLSSSAEGHDTLSISLLREALRLTSRSGPRGRRAGGRAGGNTPATRGMSSKTTKFGRVCQGFDSKTCKSLEIAVLEACFGAAPLRSWRRSETGIPLSAADVIVGLVLSIFGISSLYKLE